MQERGLLEETLVLVPTPQSLVTEGIATLAPHVLLEGDGGPAAGHPRTRSPDRGARPLRELRGGRTAVGLGLRLELQLRITNRANQLQSNQYTPGVVAPEWSNGSFVGNGRRGERSSCSSFSCQPKKSRSPCAQFHPCAPMRSVFSSVRSVKSVFPELLMPASCAPARNGLRHSGWLQQIGNTDERRIERVQSALSAHRFDPFHWFDS